MAVLADELHLKAYQLLLEEDDKPMEVYGLLTELLSKLRKAVGSEIERVVMDYLSQRRGGRKWGRADPDV